MLQREHAGADLGLVLGLSALLRPVPVRPRMVRFDLPVMLAVAVACLPIFFRGHRIERLEGAVFIGYALAYTAYLVLDATGHRAIGPFSTVMLFFVIPLTVLTFAIVFATVVAHGSGSGVLYASAAWITTATRP